MKKVFYLLACTSVMATSAFSQSKTDTSRIQSPGIKIRGLDKNAGKPIYAIDGVKQFNGDFLTNSIDPNEIMEVIVIKGDNAINLFGIEGNNGAVVVTTKAKSNSTENIDLQAKMKALGIISGVSKSSDFSLEPKQRNDSTAFSFNTSKVRIRGLRNVSKINQPLYIVDGEKIESGSIEFLDPSTIDSVTILKDTNAIQNYGLAASNGVVIIKTKPLKKINKVVDSDKN
ncbi:TonB-dependent receptor plug domain-containing protein [Pedobacter aquatilis]|uniref:TonB-dependent receptor plug domain-containing protein n=1 Tax=Pedobacter aquatilis TaxID=351343 RepID=UPI00292F225C|nr:TonB-dependent receptor plug domain-containing protein [Pedobacter aquatilis]